MILQRHVPVSVEQLEAALFLRPEPVLIGEEALQEASRAVPFQRCPVDEDRSLPSYARSSRVTTPGVGIPGRTESWSQSCPPLPRMRLL